VDGERGGRAGRYKPSSRAITPPERERRVPGERVGEDGFVVAAYMVILPDRKGSTGHEHDGQQVGNQWASRWIPHRRPAASAMGRHHRGPPAPAVREPGQRAGPASAACRGLTRWPVPTATGVERCVNRLEQFRRVATRSEQRACSYLAMVKLAAALIWR
jgi:transposase